MPPRPRLCTVYHALIVSISSPRPRQRHRIDWIGEMIGSREAKICALKAMYGCNLYSSLKPLTYVKLQKYHAPMEILMRLTFATNNRSHHAQNARDSRPDPLRSRLGCHGTSQKPLQQAVHIAVSHSIGQDAPSRTAGFLD
jgi:hypothetical protein